jgi:hypothetical protein
VVQDESIKNQYAWMMLQIVRGIAALRLINFSLWVSMVLSYFMSVDGNFTLYQCAVSGVSYCTHQYQYEDSCAPTSDVCRVNWGESISILLALTFYQSVVFFMKLLAHDGTREREGIESGEYGTTCRKVTSWVVTLVTTLLLFCFFLLEAFALPFGYKQGQIAFVYPNLIGLYIDAIISLVNIMLFLLCLCTMRLCAEGQECPPGTNIIFSIPALPLIFLSGHAIVVALAHLVSNWEFVNSSLFFMSFSQEFVFFKAIRTFFSTFTITEACLTYFFLAFSKRAWVNAKQVVKQSRFAFLVLCWPSTLIRESL